MLVLFALRVGTHFYRLILKCVWCVVALRCMYKEQTRWLHPSQADWIKYNAVCAQERHHYKPLRKHPSSSGKFIKINSSQKGRENMKKKIENEWKNFLITILDKPPHPCITHSAISSPHFSTSWICAYMDNNLTWNSNIILKLIR